MTSCVVLRWIGPRLWPMSAVIGSSPPQDIPVLNSLCSILQSTATRHLLILSYTLIIKVWITFPGWISLAFQGDIFVNDQTQSMCSIFFIYRAPSSYLAPPFFSHLKCFFCTPFCLSLPPSITFSFTFPLISLQEDYNRLLTKYAEAENTIDRLRLEAKVVKVEIRL